MKIEIEISPGELVARSLAPCTRLTWPWLVPPSIPHPGTLTSARSPQDSAIFWPPLIGAPMISPAWPGPGDRSHPRSAPRSSPGSTYWLIRRGVHSIGARTVSSGGAVVARVPKMLAFAALVRRVARVGGARRPRPCENVTRRVRYCRVRQRSSLFFGTPDDETRLELPSMLPATTSLPVLFCKGVASAYIAVASTNTPRSSAIFTKAAARASTVASAVKDVSSSKVAARRLITPSTSPRMPSALWSPWQ
jgi:hypothetical protein